MADELMRDVRLTAPVLTGDIRVDVINDAKDPNTRY